MGPAVLLADLAVIVRLAILGEALGRGVLGEHRVEIEDLTQLHLAIC